MKEKAITVVLTIMMIIVPMVIIPGSKSYLPKLIILLICGLLLLILFLINYKKIVLDKIDILILIFAALVFISTICSSNIKRSIFGAPNRYEGMLTIFTYILIYLCSKKFLKYKNINTLIKILYVIYIPICLFGILQYYIKLPTNDFSPIFNKGVSGTFRKPKFYGELFKYRSSNIYYDIYI